MLCQDMDSTTDAEKCLRDLRPCKAVTLGLQAASVLHLEGHEGTHCYKSALTTLRQLIKRALKLSHCQIRTLPQCYIAIASTLQMRAF